METRYKHKRKWSAWVREQRNEKDLTRKDLAELAGLDPSYITLIERDGFIPRRDAVGRIGDALYKCDEALFRAGYLPESYDPAQVHAGLESARVLNGLESGLRFELLMVCDLSPEIQAACASVVRSFREALQAAKAGK